MFRLNIIAVLTFLCSCLTVRSQWVEKIVGEGAKDWRMIASSSDGVKLAATVDGGNIYLSTDSGNTWSENIVGGGTKYWLSIASSSDGMKLAAGEAFGNIYTYNAPTPTSFVFNTSTFNIYKDFLFIDDGL